MPILKIVQDDPWLSPYSESISRRHFSSLNKEKEVLKNHDSLKDFASGYLYFGLHKTKKNWIFREWAPNATEIFLIGEFSNWLESEKYKLKNIGNGNWEIILPLSALKHGQLYKLLIKWQGNEGFRIPSYATRVIQHEDTKIFDAQIWLTDESFTWKNKNVDMRKITPLIYEAHIGMATEEEKVGSFREFHDHVLPWIAELGYNTIQLMAIQEHPYYGSFGYHVSNYFAVSSRFGTPTDLKELIDEAHAMGIAVIMDIVHSHSVKNELEGLGLFDGTPFQYFHASSRRDHVAWDSLCFDYSKNEVIHFLLSNCKFWLDEYHFDGFRFDGITSMLYFDHGLSKDFTNYDMYYDGNQDQDAIIYMTLANKMIHEVNPGAITIAEEMSGMPGLAESFDSGGYGFDYRLAMGIPDYWIKIIKERSDENWNVNEIFHELTSKRAGEKTISYSESHDQALVGDKTIFFRLVDKEMYWHMNKESQNIIIERGIALQKIIRLLTISTAGGGYLNFIGNEFGHPEWIDFPREGNNWSYKYARRQWHLVHDKTLKFSNLSDFDKDMLNIFREYPILESSYCNYILGNQGDQILAYSRKEFLFVFNLNPNKSFTDYGIQISPGKYQIILNTDSVNYGGFGNIDESLFYITQRQGKISSPDCIKLYLPSRVGIVLKKIKSKSVYSI